jgi:hypothetical protein
MPVSHHPEGTDEIPVPHTRFDWMRRVGDDLVPLRPTISVEVRPGGWFGAPPAPAIEGWEPFFVAHYGQERTVYSYRPTQPTV